MSNGQGAILVCIAQYPQHALQVDVHREFITEMAHRLVGEVVKRGDAPHPCTGYTAFILGKIYLHVYIMATLKNLRLHYGMLILNLWQYLLF